MKSMLTIITPTYNREELLPRLYESLLRQTNPDFVWLVVDDGSEDGTPELIRRYRQEQKIRIIYERQQNSGKHVALNRGIAMTESELTYIVDSDDYLPEDAVDVILSCHERYKDTPNLCGYSFLRCHSDGRVNTAYFPEDGKVDTYLQVRINGRIGGDKAEVFYTKILRQYPFPVFAGEKYMPEDVVWMQMSGSYQMVHLNKNTYICDYLEGGLTNTGRRMKIHSPKGMVLRSQIYLENRKTCMSVKIKMMILYQIYGRFARYGSKKLFTDISNKFLYLLCYLPSFVLYQDWRRKYKEQ